MIFSLNSCLSQVKVTNFNIRYFCYDIIEEDSTLKSKTDTFEISWVENHCICPEYYIDYTLINSSDKTLSFYNNSSLIIEYAYENVKYNDTIIPEYSDYFTDDVLLISINPNDSILVRIQGECFNSIFVPPCRGSYKEMIKKISPTISIIFNNKNEIIPLNGFSYIINSKNYKQNLNF